MNFNSIAFAIYMGIVFCVYWTISNQYRWIVVLAASCCFYLGFGVRFFVLLSTITVFSFLAGMVVGIDRKDKIRKKVYILSIIAIVCILVYFKYAAFLIQSMNALLKFTAIQLHPFAQKIALPVGISFYSFKALSYVIDVYKGRKPEDNLLKYAAFMFFFPEIASGPIDRADCLLPQLTKNHQFSYCNISYGLKLTAWGLFKKIIVADTLAFYVDWVYGAYENFSGFSFLLTSFFFTVQIYCDFSGYSDMAIGLARMLDIEVKENFRSPYFSSSVQEFWRRWHISLSTWFRDYLYIPLGGNRKGDTRKNINLLITFLVSGLWHGANWTFVFWGSLHGTAQVLENTFLRLFPAQSHKSWWKQTLKTVLVFLFCNFAWIFFRADTIGQAGYMMIHMFDGIMHPIQYLMMAQRSLIIDIFMFSKICIIILLVFLFDMINIKKDVIDCISKQRIIVRWSIYVVFSFVIIVFLPVAPGTDFLYFQF